MDPQTSKVVEHWITAALVNISQARRSGNPSAIRCAEAAYEEVQQAVQQVLASDYGGDPVVDWGRMQ